MGVHLKNKPLCFYNITMLLVDLPSVLLETALYSFFVHKGYLQTKVDI